MPIYEYKCSACGRIEEAFQKVSEAPLITCAHCQGKLSKLISHSAFHLKGSGWYVTDYANKAKNSSATTAKGGDDKKSAPDKPADSSAKTASSDTSGGD